MSTFPVHIASVDEVLYAGEVVSVTLPGSEGDMTILSNHSPLVSTLRKGTVTIRTADGEVQQFPIEKGVLEVSNNRTTVLL